MGSLLAQSPVPSLCSLLCFARVTMKISRIELKNQTRKPVSLSTTRCQWLAIISSPRNFAGLIDGLAQMSIIGDRKFFENSRTMLPSLPTKQRERTNFRKVDTRHNR